jgi:hypothetical protein
MLLNFLKIIPYDVFVPFGVMVLVDFTTFHFQHEIYITNLTYDKLIMKIVQSLFIHRFTHFYTQISCVENMFDTQMNVLTDEVPNYQ